MKKDPDAGLRVKEIFLLGIIIDSNCSHRF
jgi:hypothetical protein